MKRSFLLTSAAVTLVLGLAPALAQDRSTERRNDPALQSERNQPATQRATEQRTRSDRRSTTGQSSPDQPKTTQSTSEQPRSEQPSASSEKKEQPSRSERQQNTSSDQNKSPATTRAQEPNQPSRAERNEPNRTNAQRQPSDQGEANKATVRDRTPSNERQQNTQADRNAGSGHEQTRVSASLDQHQQTRLHTAISHLDAKPVTNVNVSVSVGTVVPSRVALVPLPRTIVEIMPQYRGYDYFVVRDEVVVVEPRTHKIVDVIERSGPSRARAEVRHERPKLTEKQREVIRKHVSSRRTTTGTSRREIDVEVGRSVPETVEIQTFPEEVYREVPEIRTYRYIERGGDVYLVDPGDRQVIEEIR